MYERGGAQAARGRHIGCRGVVRVEAARGERVGCGDVVGEEAQSPHTAQGAGRCRRICTRVKALRRVVVRMGVRGMGGVQAKEDAGVWVQHTL